MREVVESREVDFEEDEKEEYDGFVEETEVSKEKGSEENYIYE